MRKNVQFSGERERVSLCKWVGMLLCLSSFMAVLVGECICVFMSEWVSDQCMCVCVLVEGGEGPFFNAVRACEKIDRV